jgi:hypothetical protein
MMQNFAVVPPISNDTARSSPHWCATLQARTAPPAGPDSTNRTGYCLAVSRVVIPPAEVIIKKSPDESFLAERNFEAIEIGCDQRFHVGVRDRGTGAVEFAYFRADTRRK